MNTFIASLRLVGTLTMNVTAVFIYAAGGRDTAFEIVLYSIALFALIIGGYLLAPLPRDFTRGDTPGTQTPDMQIREYTPDEFRNQHDVEADEIEADLNRTDR